MCICTYNHVYISHMCVYCACMHMYVPTYVRTYVCMYVCMHVCMYACMYVCMYVHLKTYVYNKWFSQCETASERMVDAFWRQGTALSGQQLQGTGQQRSEDFVLPKERKWTALSTGKHLTCDSEKRSLVALSHLWSLASPISLAARKIAHL